MKRVALLVLDGLKPFKFRVDVICGLHVVGRIAVYRVGWIASSVPLTWSGTQNHCPHRTSSPQTRPNP
jgi:hypothetical protein